MISDNFGWKVIKRDGRVVDWNIARILRAASQAFNDIHAEFTSEVSTQLFNNVITALKEKYPQGAKLPIEDIQDVVENGLMSIDKQAARAYILYRANRTRVRELASAEAKAISDIVLADAADVDNKRENANIDGDAVMGSMLQIGTTVSKKFSLNTIFSPKHAAQHTEGKIYLHDLDFSALTWNCEYIALDKLLAHGFSTGHGYVRSPSNIRTACNLTNIVIQSSQNDQFGGQSIPYLDYALAPYVAKSYIRNFCEYLCTHDDEFEIKNLRDVLKQQFIKPLDQYIETHQHILTEDGARNVKSHMLATLNSIDLYERAHKYSLDRTERDTYQGMEAMIHNFSTMNSRAGAQVPFSSVNYGTDTSAEGRMVIKCHLEAMDAGLGNHETAIFPITIFQLMDEFNGKGAPNYDLFQLACKVSANRLYPNFVNCDATFNKQYYRPGHPETLAAAMGCTRGDEVVIWQRNGIIRATSFETMFYECKRDYPITETKSATLIETNGDVTILDSNSQQLVEVKRIIRNHLSINFRKVILEDGSELILTADHPLPVVGKGRTFVDDLAIGDQLIHTQYNTVNAEQNLISPYVSYAFSKDLHWLAGFTLVNAVWCDNSVIYTVTGDNRLLVDTICNIIKQHFPEVKIEIGGVDSDFGMIITRIECSGELVKGIFNYFHYSNINHSQVPQEIFSSTHKDYFLAGILDASDHGATTSIRDVPDIVFDSKIVAHQVAVLAVMQGIPAKVIPSYNKFHTDYRVVFEITESICQCSLSHKYTYEKAKHLTFVQCPKVIAIEVLNLSEPSYDVETTSDRFDVSGFCSHNCRTRVISNIYDPTKQVTAGRGNLFVHTLNLPYLALEAKEQAQKSGENIIEVCMRLLDERVDDAISSLDERFEFIAKRKAKHYPFVLGQHLYAGSESLGPDDEVRSAIEHGTRTVGYIGLAEMLVVLTGQHHGESADSQKLGLEIITRIHDRVDNLAKKRRINYSVMGTPAEGCSGKLLRLTRKRFGIIPGVTDHEYLTNSSHIPVYYPISAFDKIRLEAPYHALCGAGCILYIECTSDITQNLPAFEKLVRFMHDSNAHYFAINHPVDQDPVCGYVGHIPLNGICPRCGRREGEGVPAYKLLQLRSYSPAPQYAVRRSDIEQNDVVFNMTDNITQSEEN